MIFLTLDASSSSASVSVTKDDVLVYESYLNNGLTHSSGLMPMVEDMLKNAEIPLDSVDLLAVAHGPGSFTGIRIGVSTVKGLAWAANKPCTGVSTLEAMAWHGLAHGGYICPVMDARRGQVYNALFEIKDAKPCRMTPDRPIALSELVEELRALNAPVFLVGDGTALAKAYFDANGIPCEAAPENLVWQSAWGVAMAAADKPAGNADSLLPVYLRLSQAERERQERLAREEKVDP